MEPLHRYITQSLLLSLSLLLASCVSVNLKPKAALHSTEYKFQAPASSSFRKIDSEQTDIAWQNEKSGNTIAVLSECSETRDPSLSDLEAEVSQVLSDSKVIRSQPTTFEEREALRTLIEGKIDGVSASVDVLTFKKNSCSYTLTYMGRSQGFEKDHAVFENFLKGFKVP
jgi:hypothetical protein